MNVLQKFILSSWAHSRSELLITIATQQGHIPPAYPAHSGEKRHLPNEAQIPCDVINVHRNPPHGQNTYYPHTSQVTCSPRHVVICASLLLCTPHISRLHHVLIVLVRSRTPQSVRLISWYLSFSCHILYHHLYRQGEDHSDTDITLSHLLNNTILTGFWAGAKVYNISKFKYRLNSNIN